MTGVFNLDEMLGWAADLYDMGMKRPGTAAGARAEAYLLGVLKGLGLPRVWAEDVPFTGWFHDHVMLTVQGPGGTRGFSPQPISYGAFTPPGGITGKILDAGSGTDEDFTKEDFTGAVALVTYAHGELPYDMMREIAHYVHDPDGTLAGKSQIMSWLVEEERRAYDAAAAAGAAGIISVFPFDITPYLCYDGTNPFTGRMGSIPGVGLKKSEGEALQELLSAGEARAVLTLTGHTRSALTRNIISLVPGESDRILQVACHHDSMWSGATEDTAGVAAVLALAKKYAAVKPKLTLAFVLDAAECLVVIGSRAYIGRHVDDMIHNFVCDLHIEHFAREYIIDPSGALVPNGDIQPRGLFVTDTGPLVEIAKDAVITHNLRRTTLLPTDTPLGVPTDASAYNRAGLPVISLISAPIYWNAAEDTWDKIAADEIIPATRAYDQMIQAIMDRDPDDIRIPGPPRDGYILT
ncbi:MAG: M28 family peptidase [Deltaproteobacteria bacterium]|nr:M28 family peptidase [Candidatus Zymogenaceae bacterium]